MLCYGGRKAARLRCCDFGRVSLVGMFSLSILAGGLGLFLIWLARTGESRDALGFWMLVLSGGWSRWPRGLHRC